MEIREHRGTIEARTNASGKPMITGYGIVFNSDSENLGGFIEQVDPRSVTKTIAESDIRGMGEHDSKFLLGRVKAGSMRLFNDSNGVRYEIDVNEADPLAMAVYARVQRGDLDGSSFCFETIQESWDWDSVPARRRLLEINLLEMGPVTFPAYSASTASSRTREALRKIASKLGHPVERMAEALRSGEIRSLIDAPEHEEIEERAVWSTAYINDLPDSAFLYVEDGEKDSDGKTTPRTKRHFPYKDANGKVDLPHLRNALARIPQSDLPQSVKDEVTAKAKKILAAQEGGQNSLRVGKKLSAQTLAALQRAVQELTDLMNGPDDGEDDVMDDNDADDYARTILTSTLAEIRSEGPKPEVETVEALTMDRARAIARLREAENFRLRHAA